MRTCGIVNPSSGSLSDAADVLSTIRHHPALRDQDLDLRVTGDSEDAIDLAREAVEAGFDRILAVGGDGTLNEVVNGVGPESGVEVGVLPMGTGNDFCRSVGIPGNLEDALDALSGCVARPLDLVRVSGETERLFVNVSAGGFSGRVDEELTPEMKDSWGPLAYARSAIEVLPDTEDYHTTLRLDDGEEESISAFNLVVANGRTAAGGIQVAPRALLDDGLLDVITVRTAPLRKLVALGSRMLTGEHLDHELVGFRRARKVEVRARPGMWFNVDGELLTREPVTFQVLPGALTVLVGPDAPAVRGDRPRDAA